jgi:CheY-like chemotaxis protein
MILIVDDLADGANALCRLLAMQGYPAEWVSSGAEALAVIRSHPPEEPLLVILDEMMPNMSGLQVLQQIRADPRIAQTNAIIFSAQFDAAKRDEAMMFGAVAWLLTGGTRDCGMDEILSTITNWYEKVGGVRSEKHV